MFLLFRRDAYISALNRSEDGREYLKECWRLEQTEADRSGLRELSGQGGIL